MNSREKFHHAPKGSLAGAFTLRGQPEMQVRGRGR